MRASHLSGQIQYGLSPNPYYKQKERTNRFITAEMFSLFFVRRYVCKQTRYTHFARTIYMRYDINPLTLLTYLAYGEECKSISLAEGKYRVLDISTVASMQNISQISKGFISLRDCPSRTSRTTFRVLLFRR